MNAFIQSEFCYCPLNWMFCSRCYDNNIKRIIQRTLREFKTNCVSKFEELSQLSDEKFIFQRCINTLRTNDNRYLQY